MCALAALAAESGFVAQLTITELQTQKEFTRRHMNAEGFV